MNDINLLAEVERLRRAAEVTDASWRALQAQVQAVRALAEESRRTGRRLSALEVCDAIGIEDAP